LIFVTVGMHPQGFERLIRKADELAGKINEEVIMQIGGTGYTPENAKHFDFVTGEEIKELCQKARIVVTHGGVGTILDALAQGTPVIAVPRLKKCGEVIDDHQSYLVQELEKAGKVTAVYDIEELDSVLAEVKLNLAPTKVDRRLITALRRYVEEFEQVHCRSRKPQH